MPLPYSFLLGLFCLFAATDLTSGLPRDVDSAGVLPYLSLVVVPWLAVRVLATWTVSRAPSARRRRHARGALMQLAVPGAYGVLLISGEFATWTDQWVTSSLALGLFVKLLPLLFMEVGVNLARRQAGAAAVLPESMGGPVPFHLALVTFVTVLVLMFGAALDLVSLHRGAYVFVLSTAIGNLVWIIGFLVALCVALPLVFRLVTRPSNAVPDDSRTTASALGFPPRKVQMLRTDNRLVNAMLVGPVPGFRYLFLTDGLVSLLDPLSLRGVVAHEVGHAKAHHPLLLLTVFGLVPLLLFNPLDVLGMIELGTVSLAAIAVVVLVVAFFVMRRIAHRFELEADLLSADALGGSVPCILALHKVSQLFGSKPERETFRHPSEERRILHLLSCEGDPWFRERFERRGKMLRRTLVALVVASLGLTVWAQAKLWPVDKLILQFYTGGFVAAEQTLEGLSTELPPGRDSLVSMLRDDLAAARELYPDGGEWNEIRDDLAERALRRGRIELLRNGPKSARRWFAVGMAKPHPTPLELSLYLYSEASSREDAERVAELKSHLLSEFALDDDLARSLR